MTPTTLHQLKNNIQFFGSSSFTLTSSTTGVSGLDSLVKANSAASSLMLTDCSVLDTLPSDLPSQVTASLSDASMTDTSVLVVKGTGAATLLNVSGTIKYAIFYVCDDQIEVCLVFNLPVTWNFNTGYPNNSLPSYFDMNLWLANTGSSEHQALLYDLGIAGAQVALSSVGIALLQKGVNFYATDNSLSTVGDHPFSVLTKFDTSLTSIGVEGRISAGSTGKIQLNTTPLPTFKIPLPWSGELAFNNIRLGIETPLVLAKDEEGNSERTLSFDSSLVIGSHHFDVSCAAILTYYNTTWLDLKGAFTGVSVTMDEIASLIPSAELKDALPDAFAGQGLALKSCELQMDANQLKVSMFRLNVQTLKPWYLFERFGLSTVDFQISAFSSGDSFNFGVRASGDIIINQQKIATVASFPDFKVKGKSDKTFNLPINSLLITLGVPSIELLNGMSITQLDFVLEPHDKLYAFSITLSESLSLFDSKFSLESITLRLNQYSDSSEISLSGVAEIGGMGMYLQGTHENGGFSFNGYTTTSISVKTVLSDINNQLGVGLALPASITDLHLSISALSFSYNTASDEFDFGFTLDSPASVSKITGDISTDKSSHSFTAFHVTRTKTEQEAKTVLTIKINAGLQLNDLLDLKGDLPTTLNPTLEEIDFSLTLDSSKGGDKVSSSTDFGFSTTFIDSGHQFEFKGVHKKITSDKGISQKIFGGNIYSPSGGTLDMGGSFPIELELKNIFIAKVSQSSKSTTVSNSSTDSKSTKPSFTIFGSDLTIDADFNLSTLPVVGSFLTEAKFAFNALRFTYLKPKSSSQKSSGSTPSGISADELTTVNTFLQEINVAPLVTAQSSANNSNGDKANFPSGYSLQGSLILGDNAMTIPLHTSFAASSKGSGSGSGTPPSPSTSTSPSTASPVGKKFGPVTIDSVGLGLRDGGIGLKFTGGLTIGPVEFDLIGFEITTPIDKFDPDITIEGLGLDINKGALSLQGLMMEGEIDIPEMDYSTGKVITKSINAYSGALTIGYKQYNLAALGSYGQLPDGSPTMFMYAFLGAPLGGIPAFFVTGVAAGFGYNRTFNLPAPTEISSFPLIQPVIGSPPAGAASKSNVADNFAAMNQDFLPKEGAFWGAIGVRGESFKMVESFVLLDVQFGDTLEIDLIGISNMTFPTPAEGDTTHPLAKIIIGIEARILPEQGVLTIDGAFQPGTYIFNPNAHLSGGFGMLSIFSDQTSGTYNGAKEGAFICSIGGYPSGYPIKSYYPQPQRIALNWQINQVHSIKGSGYFAITPEAMMAGGSFANLYHIGGPFDISASFILAADFIIYWKPYHYEAGVSLEIDVCAAINVDLWLVSIHLDFNMDLGADLQVWGPPFAGKGYLTVHAIVSFSVDVSFGDVNPAPAPISWTEFSNSFLPASDKILNAAVGSGLISTVEKTGTKTKIDVVNPKEMSLVCHTVFPLKSVATSTNVAIGGTSATDFGIAPMAKTSGDVQSTLTVIITKNGVEIENSEANFAYRVLTRNLPSAMWQAAEKEGSLPNTQDKDLIPDLACGIEITPKAQKPVSPFTVTEPGEEIIKMPSADVISAFTYGASNFSMTANPGA